MPALLSTKFYPPAPHHHRVMRDSIFAALEDGLKKKRPLTLVSAPAGYGKSVAVAEWFGSKTGTQAAWLSLDEADDEPERFFTYLVAALRQTDQSFCSELFAVLQSGQVPSAQEMVTTLANAMLDWDTLHILALDDFHHIQDQYISYVLTSMLTHSPRNFHLVLMTREDPPLPLGRLRARGQLTEIRAADLRFSQAEAARLLHDSLHLDLSADHVIRLTERTEGWAAGLQMAGLSLQGRENPGAFVQTLSGSHRFILDYLTEEVLKTQPPEVQDFLLETSILPRLNGNLCDALTARSNSASLLERLLEANLFIIPLDDQGHWYRYHHLFAELLQHRLRRERGGDLARLHQRASLWFESQGDLGIAIEHALQAADFERVVGLMERHHWDLINRGYSHRMEAWLKSIPTALPANCPQIYLSIIWGLMLRGDFANTGPYLAMAQSGLAALPPESLKKRVAQADLFVLQSTLAQVQGSLPEALELAEKARALVPAADVRLAGLTSLAFGAVYRQMGSFEQAHEHLLQAIQSANRIEDYTTAMIATAHLSLMLWPLGRLRYLAEKAEEAITRAEAVSGIAPLMIGAVHAVLGQIYYEWDRLEDARESLLHGIRMAALSGHKASLVYGRVHLARLHQGQGDLKRAAQYLKEAGEVLNNSATPEWVRPDWLAQRVSLLLAQGQLTEAESALKSSGIPSEAPVTFRTDTLHLAWLRWMIASRHPGAFSLAARIVHSAETQQRTGTLIYALVLGAKAGGGIEWLARARQLAEPEGYQRVFIDEAGDIPVQPPDLVEQLTGRELEVLRLMTEGLTYAQMAERLVVSVNTVRYHVKGVYGKLGVEKQVQAIEKGRALGLI